METQQKIKNRMVKLDERMAILEEVMSSEMRKPFYNRRYPLLLFLRKEQSVCEFALSELKGLLKEQFIVPMRSGRSWLKSTSKEMETIKEGSFIFQITSGLGLGDAVLMTPSFRAIKDRFPGSKIVVIARPLMREVLKHNPYIDRLPPLWVGCFHRFFAFVRRKTIHRLRYGYLGPSLFYQKKAAEIIAEMMGLKLDDYSTEVFLTKEEEEKARRLLAAYKNPVIIDPSTVLSRNKLWFVDRWEELVKSMPEFTFIQLGIKGEEPFINGAVDMRGRTQIREAIALVKHALCYVGVDSFLAHVAAAVNTPGVILFGASSPSIWGHDSNINIYKQKHCSPCIDVLRQYACPYERKCMESITVEDVREAILRQVRKNSPIESPVAAQGIERVTAGIFTH